MGLLGPNSSFATISIESSYGGEKVENRIYYAVKYSTSAIGTTVDPSSGLEFFTKNAALDDFTYHILDVESQASADSSFSEALKLRVTGSQTYTPGSGETLFLSATVKSSSSSPIYIPIAAVNRVACDDTLCLRKSGDTSYFYGVKLSSNTTLSQVELSFYPRDICKITSLDECTTFTGGASGSSILPVTGSSSKAIEVTFAVRATTSSVVPDLTSASTDKDNALVTLNFQANPPSLTCPATAIMENLYFPGDAEIHVDTTRFTFITNGFTSLQTNHAPLSSIVVVLAESPITPGNTTYANNGLSSSELAVNTDVLLTGLKNTTSAETHDYNLLFGVRDKTGLIALGATTAVAAIGATAAINACALGSVRASAIQSFLKKSKCFIATATFQSMDAAPVVLLREFRDEILSQFSFGRRFIDWYYAWSPPAADWVLEHPWIRFPLLMMMIPLQVSVWLAVNYKIFLGLLLLSVFGVTALYRSTSREMRR